MVGVSLLTAIGKNGGPRCCKRDSYLAIIEAVGFTKEKLNIEMELDKIECSRSKLNNQCIEEINRIYAKFNNISRCGIGHIFCFGQKIFILLTCIQNYGMIIHTNHTEEEQK